MSSDTAGIPGLRGGWQIVNGTRTSTGVEECQSLMGPEGSSYTREADTKIELDVNSVWQEPILGISKGTLQISAKVQDL